MASNPTKPTVPDNSLNSSSKLKNLLQFAPIISIAIAALGLFITQSIRKKEVTCTYIGSENLVHIDNTPLTSALTIRFRDRQVSALNKMTFEFKNTGASAIKGEDIREPVGLVFPASANILSASLDGTTPVGFEFKVESVNEGTQFIRFSFPLLNSGDAAYISVYTYNSELVAPRLSGRIVDVRQLRMEDLSSKRTGSPLSFIQNGTIRVVTEWTLVAINAIVAVFCLGYLVKSVFEFIRLTLWRSKWAARYKQLFEQDFKASYPNVNINESKREESTYQLFFKEGSLEKSGITPRPTSTADEWGEFLLFVSIIGSIAVTCSLVAVFIFESIK